MGAASMGPRPFGRGRNISVRDARAAVKASMGPRPFGRGRRRGHVYGDLLSRHASMGPRPFGRGRSRSSFVAFLSWRASMGPRPFGRGRSIPADSSSRDRKRFNGAATFRSRKAAPPQTAGAKVPKLQWGRDLSVAEGRRLGPRARGPKCASMGPRPFGRGRQQLQPYTPKGRPMLQWGRDLSVAEGRRACKPSTKG